MKFKKIILKGICIFCLIALLACSVSAAEEKSEVKTITKIEWKDLDGAIRGGNLNMQALDKNISSIETVDYENMYYSLRKQMNQISAAQEFMAMTGQNDKMGSLAQTMATLRGTYDDIKSGKLQRNSDNVKNQLANAQNQVIASGQMLYINILAMERSLKDGERGVATIDRKLVELRLRKTFGQVSDKTVEEVENTRKNTISSLETLRSTIKSCKAQLQLLMGAEPTGELELGKLPEILGNESGEIDFETDAATAKGKSFTISNAKVSADIAELDYEDAKRDYNSGDILGYQRDAAKYTYEAAKYTHEAEIQNFEFSFAELYRSILNCEQVLENKKDAVSFAEKKFETAKKQYELGRISYFKMLDEEDALATARSAEKTAESDLFTALNKYDIAVKYGICN